jgi:SAM-dependent methyltransferase
MIKYITFVLRTRGLRGLFSALYRRLLRPKVTNFQECAAFFQDKIGIEIGGPSPGGVFGRHGLFPVYPLAARIDNCNFGSVTVWEGAVQPGATFHYDDRHAPGTQYVGEATDLGFIADRSYDFVLSSHTLEHVANPLRALAEWKRVLKDSGVLALVLPHRDGTFDRHRPVTALSHLIDDQRRNMGEDDLTHLDEILALHDMTMDPEAEDRATFKARAMNNMENRCLHHHVFDTRLAVEMADLMGFQILIAESWNPFHIFIIAQKQAAGDIARNDAFLANTTGAWRSPFRSDASRDR